MPPSSRSVEARVADRVMSERVAVRHVAADDEAREVLEAALNQLRKYRAWLTGFPATLRHAQGVSAEIGDDYVWQDDFVDFWAPFTSIQRELLSLFDTVSDVSPDAAATAEPYMDPPDDAQIEFVTEDTRFLERAGYPRKQIAYSTQRLEAWHANFAHWLGKASRGLRELKERV